MGRPGPQHAATPTTTTGPATSDNGRAHNTTPEHRTPDSSTAAVNTVAALRETGVTVLYGEGGFTPNPPGERHPYPWHTALDTAEEAHR